MSKAEKFIQDYTRNCSNEHVEVKCKSKEKVIFSYEPWLTPDDARKAVEIAREEEWEYMAYQLELKLPEILDYNGVKVNRNAFINDLKQAMKDE